MRFNVTRAVLGAVGATLVLAIAWRLTVGPLAWQLFAGSGAAALVYAALWDLLPPRTHPVGKALAWALLGALALQLPLAALPAVVAWALVLGLVYRPHPAAPKPLHQA